MEIKVGSLTKRVEELEVEVAQLRGNRIAASFHETVGQRGARLLREGRANAGLHAALGARAFRDMGIPLSPSMTIGELHEQMVREGVRPEDNIGSRGIIEMREE
jgi:hypothetical protein